MKHDLAALISSRICHDLISPIGAIGNGIELLTLEAGLDTPETRLICESVAQASARIRFFRIAFGAALGGEQMARQDVEQILEDIQRIGRRHILWQSERSLPRREVKCAFLAIQCLESCIGAEGEIEVTQKAQGWSCRGRAARLRLEPELWAILTRGEMPESLAPQQVQFALLQQALAAAGARIELASGTQELHLAWSKGS